MIARRQRVRCGGAMWIAVLGLGFLPRGAPAQNAALGLRSVSFLVGALHSEDGYPSLLSTRYRLQTAQYGAAEGELGVFRLVERGCLDINSSGAAADCNEDHSTVFLGTVTYGASIPLGRLRPYLQGGVGGGLSSRDGVVGFGIGSAGFAMLLAGGWSARFEAGRRFNGSGGATHVLAGVEFGFMGR